MAITLGALEKAVNTDMAAHETTAATYQAALDKKIEAINSDGTRHKDYIAEKEKEARDAASPKIYETLGHINSAHESLVNERRFWESKPFILSQKPLTEPLNGLHGAPAKDGQLEASSRLALLTELRMMKNDQIHLFAEDKKSTKQYGALYLATLENGRRDPKSPDWQPISLDDVVLDDQVQALALFDKANRIANGISMRIQQAMGKPVSAIDRLNAARGGTFRTGGPLPTGNAVDRLTASRAGA